MILRNITILFFVFSCSSSFAEYNPGSKQKANAYYPFSRVFTTQQQRHDIDLARRAAAKISREMQEEKTPTVLPISTDNKTMHLPEQVRFSGMLIRSDGKNMAWFDGRSVLSKDKPKGTVASRKISKHRLKVPVRVKSKYTSMKPGQVWLVDEGRVEENYLIPDTDPIVTISSDNESKPTDTVENIAKKKLKQIKILTDALEAERIESSKKSSEKQ